MKKVRIQAALAVGWEGTKRNWPVLLGVLGLYVAAQVAQNLLEDLFHAFGLMGFVLMALSLAVNILVAMILAQVGLQIAKDGGAKTASLGDLDLEPEVVGRYFLGTLLPMGIVFVLALIVGIGLLTLAGITLGVGALASQASYDVLLKALGGSLAVVAAMGAALLLGLLYAAFAFCFGTLAILHQGLGPIEAYKESLRLTAGIRLDLILAALVFVGVLLLGLGCFFVGILPALMVLSIAWPALYLEALAQSGPRPGASQL